MGARPRNAHIEIALKLSLLLFLLHGGRDSWATMTVRILCLVMLLHRDTLEKRWLWTLLAAVLLADLGANWLPVDNHKFLITYWALACCLSTWSSDPRKTLAWNGRCIIALAFTFATFWKVHGGEYLDGSFFLFEFLLDERFSSLAALVGMDPNALELNRQASQLLRAFPAEGLSLDLTANDQLRTLALWMSYGTIAIEGAVALAFWWSLSGAKSDLSDWILIAFCVATYTLTPITGFGLVLVVMGFAQCRERNGDAKEGYLWAFVLVQFAQLDDIGLVSSLMR